MAGQLSGLLGSFPPNPFSLLDRFFPPAFRVMSPHSPSFKFFRSTALFSLFSTLYLFPEHTPAMGVPHFGQVPSGVTRLPCTR